MADIDLTPTEEMAANAKRGLELRRKHGRGGTAVGVARARDISNRKTLSPETVRRMHAFFSRHEKNKAGGEDDAGYIAWMLWSGDAGQGWAKRKVEQMDKSENQRSETYKAIAKRLGSAATNHRPGAKAKMGRAEQVMRDGSVHLDFRAAKEWLASVSEDALRYIINDAQKAAKAMPDGNKWNYYHDLSLTAQDELQRRKKKASRPGAKAAMSKATDALEYIKNSIASGKTVYVTAGNRTTKVTPQAYAKWEASGKPLFKISSDGALLMASGSSYVRLTLADEMLARVTAMSRPGAKAKMQNAQWMQHVSNMLRDLTNERQRVQVWIAGPTTVKVAGMWMAYTRYGKGAAIASRMAYYLTQAAGTPGKYSGQDIKDSPRKGTNTTIWTVSNVPEDAVSYLKAWGIGTSPKAFAGFTGESAVAYARPGAKAEMAKWTVTPTQKHGKDIEEHTAKIGRDHWKIDSMPHLGKSVGSLYRWDEMRGLRHISTGNIEQLKRQAEAISTKQDALSDVMRGFSRPGAKDTNAVREGPKISAEDEACLKMMSAADEKVSDKIRTLIAEGKPQKQAVAIALDLKRRGEL